MNPEGFLADVLAEPETLDGVLDAAAGARLPDLAGRRVVFLGMGSSRFAALTAAAALRSQGVFAVAEHASTGAPTRPGADVVAIGISASGASEETIEALARHRGISQTVAVTNHPSGALGAVADEVVALHAGEEAGGVACKTFQATLAILWLLAGARAGDLRPAVEVQRTLLDRRAEWVAPLLDLVRGAHTTYAIAPAERLSSSLQAALMLREGPRVAADATETGDWLHVDVYLSKHPDYTALLFAGSRYDAGVMEWARQRASRIVAVGPAVEGCALHVGLPGAEDPRVRSLVEVSVAEVLAAELWRERLAAGAMP